MLKIEGQLLKLISKDWAMNDNTGTSYSLKIFTGEDVVMVKADESQYNSLLGQEGTDVSLNIEPIVLKPDKPVLRLV
ncbi:hypothetical protein KPL40_19630 [Clostridium gasigenes]|uniref:hypothetical protein n=1 Tax=Clostridium gasigenes TaxID=94869 RepID=UPI001C0CD80E|nr:hypothetical protein [Clostridium gasigenes]MBU3134616.1 hypothetical protein [Clostridium gasigenes]